MRYRVTHETTYEYEELVSICHNELRLEPRETERQRRLGTALRIEPMPRVTIAERDYFGNPTHFFTVEEPHHSMVLVAQSELELEAPSAERPQTPPWQELRDALRADRSADGLAAFEACFASPLVPIAPEFARYAAPFFPSGRALLDCVAELNHRIHTDFAYRPGATSVTTPVRDVLETCEGVCQDFAHVEIACLRALGLAARYVSGYLHTQPAQGRERLVGADASHAWVSVYCGAAGWIDVDPTNDLVVSDQHLTLAWGRDYGDVSPIKGVILGGGGHTVDVGVDVELLAG
ncbi:MAG TPA: transglutaminase family protein [Myxococcota bacterium]|nr:transglutaminase family protein [Myxococcota bacterium]